MTVVVIRKSEVKKIVGNKNDQEIDHVLSMMSTAVEKFDNEKELIEVEVAPNRPDMLSEQGILRALKTFTGKEKGLHKIEVVKSGYKLIIEKSLPKDYPYGISCVVKGLKFDDEKIKEVIDIQEKLGATLLRKRKKGGIGLYPLEKISFPIKLVGMKPEDIKFRPLEFPRELNGRQILSQHPTGREYGHLLEGWDRYPVFIDAKKVIMSMPPIINSHDVGKINENTKDIFVEATGTDYNLLKKLMNIIIFSLVDMGGKVYSMECVQSDGKKENIPDFTPGKKKLNIENANKLLGLKLKESDVAKLLGKMGIDYNKGNALVPAYRTDILHEVDLIEDIAIAYGYDNLIPSIPEVSSIGEISKKELIKNKISESLSGLGLIETSSYHLTTKDYQINRSGLKSNDENKFIEVENSKTEYSILRKDLSHYLLKILGENVDVEYPQEIFQTGTIFGRKNDLKEEDSLSIALAPGNFTRLKQIFEYLGRMLDLKFEISKTDNFEPYFIEGRVAEAKFNGKSLGYFGEVHPKILKNFKIKMPVALLEINLEELFKVLT
ncbi:phenylalanine--tRNA ligase subunit beta [Candidatus Pacearchaeota archaeon]|nr:phenylalanine--tRNA ligase subunit beta [Candidatus Pacearchaeota archaeon]